jgi:hypothetical protein
MPAPRNTKSKTQSTPDPTKPKRKARKKDDGRGTEPAGTALPPQPAPETVNADWECDADEELVLTFLSYFQTLEHALMRAGYTQAGHTPGSAQPDWYRFARHIHPRFDPDSSEVLQGAVSYMLWDDDNLELRNERIENAHFWENADPNNDTVWLSELVQQTGRKVIHGLNFPAKPGVDIAMVTAAMFIVEEWLRLEPEMEGWKLSGL